MCNRKKPAYLLVRVINLQMKNDLVGDIVHCDLLGRLFRCFNKSGILIVVLFALFNQLFAVNDAISG